MVVRARCDDRSPESPRVTRPDPSGLDIHPLRRLRHTRWITLKQLWKLTGVHYSLLSLIERGLQEPTPRQQIRIERALGCEPGTLFPVKK